MVDAVTRVVSNARVMMSNIAGEGERERDSEKEKEKEKEKERGVSLYVFGKIQRGDEQELRNKKREGQGRKRKREGRGKRENERVCGTALPLLLLCLLSSETTLRRRILFFLFFFGLSKITQLLVSFDRVSDI